MNKHQRNDGCAVVLFYKYFLPSEYPLLAKHPRHFEAKLLAFQTDLCQRLHLKGRLLLSAEGVNGTLSAKNADILQEYIRAVEEFELIRDCGTGALDDDQDDVPHYLFTNIDWKESSNKESETMVVEPFPDLKISIVNEIVSSGNVISAHELVEFGGTHLTPQEFHETLATQREDVVLIDVRNNFEHDIGHFVNPTTGEAATNPSTTTFSMFDAKYCAQRANELKDKKVLMYCTGGIRCEKASAMLKKRGVRDVSQLSGGIHRYLQEFGNEGFFRGLNFVFDGRVAMKPSECCSTTTTKDNDIVGRCVECHAPFDELSGSHICTVCRDLVLVCPDCQESLREYHCRRHAPWKSCYFTFLDCFSAEQLQSQHDELLQLRSDIAPGQQRHVRKTLTKQMSKVQQRIQDLNAGLATQNVDAPRRCRSCFEPRTVCDGLCWGFWKQIQQQQETRDFQEA